MNIELLVKNRLIQREKDKIQGSEATIESILSGVYDIERHFKRSISVHEMKTRHANLVRASKENAEKGFTPVQLLDLFPLLERDIQIGKNAGKNMRDLIIARDRKCRWCRKRSSSSVDHVLPIARGGDNDPWNLVGACQICNGLKSDFLPSELGWKLEYKKP